MAVLRRLPSAANLHVRRRTLLIGIAGATVLVLAVVVAVVVLRARPSATAPQPAPAPAAGLPSSTSFCVHDELGDDETPFRYYAITIRDNTQLDDIARACGVRTLRSGFHMKGTRRPTHTQLVRVNAFEDVWRRQLLSEDARVVDVTPVTPCSEFPENV